MGIGLYVILLRLFYFSFEIGFEWHIGRAILPTVGPACWSHSRAEQRRAQQSRDQSRAAGERNRRCLSAVGVTRSQPNVLSTSEVFAKSLDVSRVGLQIVA